jgi:hypothetical protein
MIYIDLDSICRYDRPRKKRGPKPSSGRSRPTTVTNDMVANEPQSQTQSGDQLEICPVDHTPGCGVHTEPDSPCSDTDTNLTSAYHTPLNSSKTQASSPDPLCRSRSSPCFLEQPVSSFEPAGLCHAFPPTSSPNSDPNRGILGHSFRYTCLHAVFPWLMDILRPEDACGLLDIFFTDESTLPSPYLSPFVFARVIRKESLLRPHKPRTMSKSLLLIILWCVSHTAPLPTFARLEARASIIRRL